MRNKTTLPKSKVKPMLDALEGRNVHLETVDGDTYNGMLQVRPDGIIVGNHPFAIEVTNVRNVREV